jgi:hypothetical protein
MPFVPIGFSTRLVSSRIEDADADPDSIFITNQTPGVNVLIEIGDRRFSVSRRQARLIHTVLGLILDADPRPE